VGTKTIGLISGALVLISAIPYFIRTFQGKIKPNLTSWALWSLIGLVLLLTYKSSGAETNVWPAVFGFTNPLLITVMIFRQHGKWKKPEGIEIACLVVGLLALGVWSVVHENKGLSQYALYLAIVADACASVPTIVSVWSHPDSDRPFAWLCFSVGYGLTILAITEHTIANYALPLYMSLGSLCIAFPLARYRQQKKTALAEWI
jgi:hypothetical protein